MRRRVSLVFSLLFLAILMSACGPENKTAAQQEKEQIQAKTEEARGSLEPLVGTYVGTMTFKDDSRDVKYIRLIVFPYVNIVANPSRNEVMEVPTLGGSLQVESKERRADDTSRLPIGTFNSAYWDAKSSKLTLSGGTVVAASGPNGSNPGVVYSLTVKVDGDRLFGQFNASHNLVEGNSILDLRRVPNP